MCPDGSSRRGQPEAGPVRAARGTRRERNEQHGPNIVGDAGAAVEDRDIQDRPRAIASGSFSTGGVPS